MTDFVRKHDASLTWVFRALVGAMLVAQLWLTNNFVTKDEFQKYQATLRTELSDYPVRISNLERFERDASKRTSDIEVLISATQKDLSELARQTTATNTLLNAWGEDLRDVSKKMDMLLLRYMDADRKASQPTGK